MSATQPRCHASAAARHQSPIARAPSTLVDVGGRCDVVGGFYDLGCDAPAEAHVEASKYETAKVQALDFTSDKMAEIRKEGFAATPDPFSE